jgi:hypothetical protein
MNDLKEKSLRPAAGIRSFHLKPVPELGASGRVPVMGWRSVCVRVGRAAVAGGLAFTAAGWAGVVALEPAAEESGPRHSTADNGACASLACTCS